MTTKARLNVFFFYFRGMTEIYTSKAGMQNALVRNRPQQVQEPGRSLQPRSTIRQSNT